jgi:hypothetical protein
MIRSVIAVMLVAGTSLAAQDVAQVPAGSGNGGSHAALLEQFLSRTDPPPTSYRAFRRLEARNERFKVDGWMEVATELDAEKRFTWTIVEEGGSSYVRNKVLRKALEAEQDAVARNDPTGAALSKANYVFDDRHDSAHADVPAGLARLGITPRRRDVLLVEGNVWLAKQDGDLLQIDGRLSKSPSFWTRNIDVMRRYARVAGVRVPVEMTSVADLRVAGRSSFRMTYRYQTINGVVVPADASSVGAAARREQR